MELYNNILVIIVGGGSGSRSEMHIFQVSHIFFLQNESIGLFNKKKKLKINF